jgi:hypothetical protein
MTKRPFPEGGDTLVSLFLFLMTLVRNQKSQGIFKISSLWNILVKVEAYKYKVDWLNVTIASAFAIFGSTAGSLLAVWCAGVVTATENVRRKETPSLSQASAYVRWRMGNHQIQTITMAAVMQRSSSNVGRTKACQTMDHQGGTSPNTHRRSGLSPLLYAAPLNLSILQRIRKSLQFAPPPTCWAPT